MQPPPRQMRDYCRACQDWLHWFPLFPKTFRCNRTAEKGTPCAGGFDNETQLHQQTPQRPELQPQRQEEPPQ